MFAAALDKDTRAVLLGGETLAGKVHGAAASTAAASTLRKAAT